MRISPKMMPERYSVRYFSGFGFANEQELFESWIESYAVAGFSYGAIKAFEHIYNYRDSNLLQLFSPAFFQHKKERFISMQLKAYHNNPNSYQEQFLANSAYPLFANELLGYRVDTNIKDLEYLLRYKWNRQKLLELRRDGIEIEVYTGAKDKIVDSQRVKEFFEDIAKVYYFNHAGHILKPVKEF